MKEAANNEELMLMECGLYMGMRSVDEVRSSKPVWIVQDDVNSVCAKSCKRTAVMMIRSCVDGSSAVVHFSLVTTATPA